MFQIKATEPETLSRVLVRDAPYPSKLGKNCHIQMHHASSVVSEVNFVFQIRASERRTHISKASFSCLIRLLDLRAHFLHVQTQ
jgi:hypothetical protein